MSGAQNDPAKGFRFKIHLRLSSVKEATSPDGDLENFRERQQRNPKYGGPLAAALFRDDFEDEGFNRFGPGSQAFAHPE